MRVLLDMIAAPAASSATEDAYRDFLGRSWRPMREMLPTSSAWSSTDAALDEMRARLYAAFRSELKPIAGHRRTLRAR